MQDLKQRVRERAYHMWTDAGCPEGRADAFWLEAQRDILAASLGTVARVTAVEKKRARKSKATSPKKRRAA
jgi:Protein of unknown function (DUF2934)